MRRVVSSPRRARQNGLDTVQQDNDLILFARSSLDLQSDVIVGYIAYRSFVDTPGNRLYVDGLATETNEKILDVLIVHFSGPPHDKL